MRKAVIFDMDGVLVDSEGLWKRAEEEVFSFLDVTMDNESCALTKSMTTNEVARIWYAKCPWDGKGIADFNVWNIKFLVEIQTFLTTMQ